MNSFKGICIETSFMLLKDLLTGLALTHDSHKRLSLNDKFGKPLQGLVSCALRIVSSLCGHTFCA